MEKNAISFNNNFIAIAAIILICVILFFLGLGDRGLWTPDETRYIVVSKEMVVSGDWINLKRNEEAYTQKPPVFFWLISFFSVLLGKFSEFSARLPSALAATATALITYLFAKKLFNVRTALLSALILSTSLAFLMASRWVILDTVLTFFALTAIYLLYLGLIDPDLRAAAYLSAFISMALATLTKGPVGIILPLLVTIIYAAYVKNSRSLFKKEFFLGFILFILIILAWLIPACLKGGEGFTKDLLLKQIFGRFFEGFDHKQPFYFYFVRFPFEFLPWTIFLPSAAIFLMKGGIKENPVKLILIWFSAIFLFFTLSRSKNDLYILPAYPAAAMAISYYWEKKVRRPRILIYIIAAVMILNTALTYCVIPYIDRYKSTKYFAQKIVKYVKPEDGLVAFNINPLHWIYYCGRRQMRELDGYDALKSYLKSDKKVFCILNERAYKDFERSSGVTGVYIIDSAPWGLKISFKNSNPELKPGETVLLISNKNK